ncbi:hypothetical protein C8J56DRAFT_929092 [Mycena floridula]|nr:hypothetical protein C8J56DRAFT_929092 [Mycena floridula]
MDREEEEVFSLTGLDPDGNLFNPSSDDLLPPAVQPTPALLFSPNPVPGDVRASRSDGYLSPGYRSHSRRNSLDIPRRPVVPQRARSVSVTDVDRFAPPSLHVDPGVPQLAEDVDWRDVMSLNDIESSPSFAELTPPSPNKSLDGPKRSRSSRRSSRQRPLIRSRRQLEELGLVSPDPSTGTTPSIELDSESSSDESERSSRSAPGGPTLLSDKFGSTRRQSRDWDPPEADPEDPVAEFARQATAISQQLRRQADMYGCRAGSGRILVTCDVVRLSWAIFG